MAALRAYVQVKDPPVDNRVETHIVAVVTDDVRKVETDWIGTRMDALEQHLRSVLDDVQGDAALAALKVNDVIDLTVAPQPTPNPFYEAWSQLQSELAKVDAGLLAPDDKRVTTARDLALSLDNATLRVLRR